MTSHFQEPTVEHLKDEVLGETIMRHPAYGTIHVYRTSGRTYLHDSEFCHDNFISVEINTAKVYVHEGKGRTYPEREGIVRFSMSEAQWATFVSSMNMGSGVPITLTRLNGEFVPQLPVPVQTRYKFKDRFKGRGEAAVASINELEAMIDGMGLSKKKADELKAKARMASRQLTDAMPWLAEHFAEHMEETVEKARMEIHGYAMGKMVAGEAITSDDVLKIGKLSE